MQHLATRLWITAGVALVGAGVIAATPVAVPLLPGAGAADIQLAADGDIIIDFVRHGQSVDNAYGILGTVPPGAVLTALGHEQAETVGNQLFNDFGGPNGVAGIFASELIRTQQTAAPFAGLEGMDPQVLSGLNELNAGIYEGFRQFSAIAEDGTPELSPAMLLYLLAPVSWTLGNYFVSMPGSPDLNGVAFNDRFTDAVQTMYDDATGSAVVSANGETTTVAFSHAESIATWVMMNVKNPDPFLQFTDPLSNTGQVVVEGNPTDGWTLVSWNGEAVEQNPDLLTALFVDWRDLITAPQTASWHIWEAILTGVPEKIDTAIATGFDEVVAAMTHFPQAVFDSITAALSDGAAAAAAEAVLPLAEAALPI